jgi:hypothetical protein
MTYTVNSDRFALKKKGESISDKELLEALVSAGHLVSAVTPKAAPASEGETK